VTDDEAAAKFARWPRIIAIDGPAAAGKGTLARGLARHLGYAYLETGLLYRAVGLKMVGAGADPADVGAATQAAQTLLPEELTNSDLRSDRAANAASRVATIPSVRGALLAFQRRFAEYPPHGAAGAVLDGRDIGTIVCPNAGLKLFITARLEIRAARRLKELQERGWTAIDSRVLREIHERDVRDRARSAGPLEPASDAIVIDTSELAPDAVLAAALAALETATPSGIGAGGSMRRRRMRR
jgi:cytidylate kinase